MKDKISTAVVLLSVLGLLVAACGSVALFQLWAIWEGAYDPVRDDGIRPQDVPALKQRLGWIGGASLAIAALSLAGLWFAWPEFFSGRKRAC
jgi:hypothetical protein